MEPPADIEPPTVTAPSTAAPRPPDPAPAPEALQPAAGDEAVERREVTQACERIAAKLGSVSLEDCTDSRLKLSGARSTRGMPILVAEYPPLPGREPLGRVLLFGGIHGDELSSVSIVYGWLETLDRFPPACSTGASRRWSTRTACCAPTRSG